MRPDNLTAARVQARSLRAPIPVLLFQLLGRERLIEKTSERPGLNWSRCGACITPPSPATFLTTDWFRDRLQKWTLDGAWIRTFQSPLRSDSMSIKCWNASADPRRLWQTVVLPDDECDYALEFLAFTDGGDVTPAVLPLAIYTGDQEPRPNRITEEDREYQEYVLTRVDQSVGTDRRAYFVRGTFHVAPGETDYDWQIGAQVQGKEGEEPRRVYIASIRCFKAP